ncbi:DUF1572 domain-containing protein [Dyadobacter flavalbus]|uniref:DUF1572 domain-containing protein n=1 Tax=Dyadobacter flavalbus TaxID=2579942 RepID=A0A5M8QWU2_9BACT|nr:DUF1572 family protein [Dyadobacter flavalbus]KAA6439530.1 DUF1572 domain-containing protein [Dyadobacter flavalbus]
MALDYIESVKKQFEYYKWLGEQTIHQLPEDALFGQINADSNSIAIIVKHLSGNMLSRWTDFLTSDGEKEWRDREAEFENDIRSKTELLEIWDKGWNCLQKTLEELGTEDLGKEIFIRNQGHTVIQAINRQLAHYPYHIGQIVFIGKMILGENWKSLSIPRGSSQAYNRDKFAQPKHTEHFTDDHLKQK